MERRVQKILLATLLAFVAISVISFLICDRIALKAARSTSCGSQMKSIGLAGRLWANDRVELMPTNFTCMSNELVTPLVLHCNGDQTRTRVRTWEEFSEDQSSYVIVSPGAKEGMSNIVFIRCLIHGHLGFTDGSVFNASRTKVVGKR